MQQEIRYIFLRLGLYSLFLGGLTLVMGIDANGGEAKFFENSYTERAQEAMLLSLSLGMFYCASRLQIAHNLAAFFAGFFMLCFIRELDALLEQNLGTGVWQALVSLVLAVMLFKVWKSWPALAREFSADLMTYHAGLLAAGFLTTFIFSRLIGSEELWMAIMEETYQRNVKNAVEEGVELLGDALMVFAGIEFYLYHRHAANHAGRNQF